ncbi:MAG: hypothetical protein F6J87_29695, partial [Spirulina sp. SIO3F2]|nr:hypothetical protein [Spirulina sp. SIO3F2]
MLAQCLQALFLGQKQRQDMNLATYAYNPDWVQKPDDYDEQLVQWLQGVELPLTTTAAAPSIHWVQPEVESEEPRWGIFAASAQPLEFKTLFDGRAFPFELGLVNLRDMARLANDPQAFVQEAVRRILSQSELGYLLISDGLDQLDFNAESQPRPTEFPALSPGDPFTLMMTPKGTIADLPQTPEIEPIFAFLPGAIADITGQGQVLSFATGAEHQKDNLIVQIEGTTIPAARIETVLPQGQNWQNTQWGQLLDRAQLAVTSDQLLDETSNAGDVVRSQFAETETGALTPPAAALEIRASESLDALLSQNNTHQPTEDDRAYAPTRSTQSPPTESVSDRTLTAVSPPFPVETTQEPESHSVLEPPSQTASNPGFTESPPYVAESVNTGSVTDDSASPLEPEAAIAPDLVMPPGTESTDQPGTQSAIAPDPATPPITESVEQPESKPASHPGPIDSLIEAPPTSFTPQPTLPTPPNPDPGNAEPQTPNVEIPGIFTVGESGQVAIDYLFDGGGYGSTVAAFSLEGMDLSQAGTAEFAQKAAQRALSNSGEGFVAITDRRTGARFSGELGEGNNNAGDYPGLIQGNFTPGSQFGLMLLPKGRLGKVAKGILPSQPIFSFDAATQPLADVTGAGTTFSFEDLAPTHKYYDGDYNDI